MWRGAVQRVCALRSALKRRVETNTKAGRLKKLPEYQYLAFLQFSGSGLQIRIRFLLPFLVAFKIQTKIGFFRFLLTAGAFTSVVKYKFLISDKHEKIKVFLIFLLVDGRIRIRPNNYGSGSRMPKNIPYVNTEHFCVCTNFVL
jgi:hypothetical protein